jgi:predicted nucleic acid-binding Zn ribbon protein
MKRSDNIETLGDAIKRLLKAYNLDDKLNERAILAEWEEYVGPVVTKYTDKIYFKKNKLVIKLKSSVLREELSLSKTKIIQHLNDKLGQKIIEDIEFR